MSKTMEEMSRVYYVYKCFVDGELKYVGMGKGDRWKHCTSGASHVPELNRDFHEGRNITVDIHEGSLSRIQAAFIENDIICANYDKLYNKSKSIDPTTSPNISFSENAKIVARDRDDIVKKKVAELSCGFGGEGDYQKLRDMLMRLGLKMYVADIGKTKGVLLLDKPEIRYSDMHKACINYPNCDEYGCGK